MNLNITSGEPLRAGTYEAGIIAQVLTDFGIEGQVEVSPYGNGLINHTLKVNATTASYILQKINDRIFTKPESIAQNIRSIADHLSKNSPEYLFVAPLSAKGGSDLVMIDGKYYRLFHFIRNSVTRNVVETPKQAYEAARQFGKFTRLLEKFDATTLKITLKNFHDLSLRYNQFSSAIESGNISRIHGSKEEIHFLKRESYIVSEYQKIIADPEFKLRVTHHDTKISNVLFDENDNGICVIDLDTVMPGYFISDVGDMMRTYLCPVSEEETDLTKIIIRDGVYKAMVDGYSEEMHGVLSEMERRYFFYAGKFMVYMQALRFLTDHLNDDVYYGAKYAGHNLMRAKNQIMLLQKLMEKEGSL